MATGTVETLSLLRWEYLSRDISDLCLLIVLERASH